MIDQETPNVSASRCENAYLCFNSVSSDLEIYTYSQIPNELFMIIFHTNYKLWGAMLMCVTTVL